MSRYLPSDYRGPRDRSRSPARFQDRRASAASIFDNRPSAPPRNASDAPRGPRSQFDGPRASVSGPSHAFGSGPRPGYSSLRDAPPLGTSTIERGRPFRERDYERRDRVPSPRERSPLRNFKDARDYPPRDFPPRELDIGRARRGSRDGPPSAGSTYSDNTLPFASNGHRGGFGARGRGRGDHFEFRGGRGGRRAFEDREQLRRERSPPSRWGRAHSRDVIDRREERKPFDRHDDERRSDWNERDIDRPRRDLSATRTESRHSHDILGGGPPQQTPQALQINPERLALLEQAGVDLSDRRPSTQAPAAPQHGRTQMPETPSYLNGRAETMANRYNQRGSSPVNAAPAVPAFSFALAPPAATSNNAPQPANSKPTSEDQAPKAPRQELPVEPHKALHDERPEPPREVPSAPRNPPPAPKAQLAEAPPTAPRAPRAHENDAPVNLGGRLQGVRSLEGLNAAETARQNPSGQRSISPAPSAPGLPMLIQPVSPRVQGGRFGDLGPPTGPRATRMSPAQVTASPKPSFESPRSDAGAFAGLPGMSRGQTPPPSAPSGPRNRSFSVSPKVTSSTIPTAPKGSRIPPIAPRGGLGGPGRSQQDRLGAPVPWAPPSAPRNLQWNQWRRQQPPTVYNDKIVPAKRDFAGEEKERNVEANTFRRQSASGFPSSAPSNKLDNAHRVMPSHGAAPPHDVKDDMDIDKQPLHPSSNSKQPPASSHSAAQSFFGKPSVEAATEGPAVSDLADELLSSSEEDDHDDQEDLALLNAKFERQKRVLESQMVDLSGREYRATTPLESIARLARISEKDLERARTQREHQDIEHSERPSVSVSHLMPPATHSSGSEEGPDVLTPKGEAVEPEVEVQSSEDGLQDVRRPRRPTPEVIRLPYLTKGSNSFQDAEAILEDDQESEEAKTAVAAAIEQEAYQEAEAADALEGQFADMLAKWRGECEDLDRQKEEEERLERQQSMEVEAGPEPVLPPAPPINPTAEGRRQHKFASEYEFEKVLRESEETARLEQEKLDRENRKNLADMEKEAKVPDQETEQNRQRSIFIDTNRLRDPVDLTLVYSYEPPPDTFTEHEQQIFIAAFKETPKKWGEIASLLPGKTYKDCIHHYYANKWDGRFRDNRTRKLKAGGRGRGRGGKAPPRGRGSAAMADLNRTEEPVTTSESGRPKRAAAPTTFGEREQDSKAALVGPSPAKKPGNSKQDSAGDNGTEKPGKRRKGGPGDKPGRKAKAQQPLAQLAAAPSASPNTPFVQGVHPKDDVPRMQSLEEASLLTGLHTGHQHVLHHDSHMVYAAEPYMPPMPSAEEVSRSKQVGQTSSSSKSSASSYWSVPEQQDFKKYIAHFGTDFAAIAAHMGTKTQTMIKNHYQRQVDGGDKDNLKDSAVRADLRKERGEDIGPPPTPTPIVKRKYDNNQPTPAPAPRALAPHTDVMDIDDPAPPPPNVPSKHVSPPQYQPQPRFPSSAQATPISAHRIVPSPVTSAVSPAAPQAQTSAPAPARTMQHPLGQRIAFLSEARQEPRPALQSTSSFRLGQDGPPRGQQHHQTPVPDAQFMKNLAQEQERAFKMQQQQSQQDRLDSLQRTVSYQQGSAHNSPGNPPLQAPSDRRQLIDERDRGPSPSRFGQSPFSRPPFSQTVLGHPSMAGPLAGVPTFSGRSAYNPSPPKREEPSRPGSVASMQQAPSSAPAPAPEPPKRSNLMSILNSEAEDPKPVKRESITSVSARAASPAPAFSAAPSSTPQQSILPPRRGETFGQPSVPQSNFRAAGFPPPSQTPAPTSSHRHEGPASSTPAAPVKADWATRVLEQRQGAGQPSPPAVERDGRPMFSHSHRTSLMGQLNQPMRGNPSPPPHHVIGHSRTPSLTAKSTQSLREPHAAMQREAAQISAHGHGQPLHPNPYAQQPGASPFAQQPPPPQAQTHAHHTHNSSLGSAFPGMQRGPSREELIREDALRRDEALRRQDALRRDEAMRQDEAFRREDAIRQEQHQRYIAEQRDREEREVQQQWQMRQEMDRRREADFKHREAMAQAQMREDHERHAQAQAQAYGRGPPPQPLHPGAFAAAGFSQSRAPSGFGAREQAMRENEAALIEQERAQQDIMERRRREDESRRQEEAYYRHTPLGGYGHPPPPRR